MDYLKKKTLPRGTKIEVMGKTLFLDGDVKVTGHHLDIDGIWFVFPEDPPPPEVTQKATLE